MGAELFETAETSGTSKFPEVKGTEGGEEGLIVCANWLLEDADGMVDDVFSWTDKTEAGEEEEGVVEEEEEEEEDEDEEEEAEKEGWDMLDSVELKDWK